MPDPKIPAHRRQVAEPRSAADADDPKPVADRRVLPSDPPPPAPAPKAPPAAKPSK